MNSFFRILATTGLCVSTTAAHAALVTVDFDGLDGGRNVFLEAPANFYNGGLGAFGSGPGPDYGITFSPFSATSTNARAICNVTFNCDGGAGNSLFIFGDLQNGVEDGTVMHIEGGFRGIVEFDVSISNLGSRAFIFAATAFGGHLIDSTSARHPDPTNTCGRLECEFAHYSLNLADDPYTPDDVVAHALVFRTTGTDVIFVDNIRFHDLILPDAPPSTVPEPATALMVGSAGLAGALMRRRRKTS